MSIHTITLNIVVILGLVCGNNVLANEVRVNASMVEHYFSLHKADVEYSEAKVLCEKVYSNRLNYASEIVGKATVILANESRLQGDINQSLAWAQNGLKVKPLTTEVTVELLLHVMQGHHDKNYYREVIRTAEEVLTKAGLQFNQYKVQALAYKAMSHALLGNHEDALVDLHNANQLFIEHKIYFSNAELLEVIANAHYYLGDYQDSVDLHSQAIKIKHDRNDFYSIERNYYNLARSYIELKRYDDAYNAFWNIKSFSKGNPLSIWHAFASLGMGDIHLLQSENVKAFEQLTLAEGMFRSSGLVSPYVSNLIALSQSSLNMKRLDLAQNFLIKALALSKGITLNHKQITLYLLLAKLYEQEGNYEKAYQFQRKYYDRFTHFHSYHKVITTRKNPIFSENISHQKLMMQIAKESELRATFTDKLAKKSEAISWLSSLLFLAVALLMYFIFKYQRMGSVKAYDLLEKANDYLEPPEKTKELYQYHYKKARKYDYSIAIGYLSIDNWKELCFHFNKQTVAEVLQNIALLINENKGEFDQAGIINEGEYLLLCPHQTRDELTEKLTNLTEALKVRFFANLGDFSVKINFSCDEPGVQDIDPYIFLSRLSESTSSDL